ncbi:MAG: HAD-IIIC family phosphatase [Candidatus Pacebacteria bacterium]|nr:HAD-IIIC family phosphatase [Candidatus Paceibacterota bacterium]
MNIRIISDFNAETLAHYLNNSTGMSTLTAECAPFGQVSRQLLALTQVPKDSVNNPGVVVLWTRPQGIITAFNEALNYARPTRDDVLKQVIQFAETIRQAKQPTSAVFIPAWTFPPHYRGYGLLNMQTGIGLRNLLHEMNLTLSRELASQKDIFLLDAERWVASQGDNAYDPRLWYMGKIPFSSGVFKTAADEIKAGLESLDGKTRKLIILDLDNTLWGGVVGDAGWNTLRLGGHDPIGEAYADFQSALKALTNQGVLLGIVSKNTEQIALEAFEKHPEMVLQLTDFAGWRINWNDKASEVANLVMELNLGLDAAVFIDDNPMERARVAESLPEVLVPEWPKDPLLYRQALEKLACFDKTSINPEDTKRTAMYAAERERKRARIEFLSLEQWLNTLAIEVQAEPVNHASFARMVQLFNKTNQMNLSTRRLTESELQDWLTDPNHCMWTFRVTDKFGDSGLTGIGSLFFEDNKAHIIDFILSCRVMGRDIEEAMLHVLTQHAADKGAKIVEAVYLKTAKNKPCLEFWQESEFNCKKNQTFEWHLGNAYPLPRHIKLKWDS